MLLFQAVSPQLPHAGSSDIHFSLYTSSPSPLSSSSSFPHLPAERSQVSIWFGTLTSLSCFSSFFPFKAQNLSPSLSLWLLITQLLASTSASPGLAPFLLYFDFSLSPWWSLCVLGVLYDFVCVFCACCFCHCRVVLLCRVPLPPLRLLPVYSDPPNPRPLVMASPSQPSFLSSFALPLTLRASSHIHLPLLCLCLSIVWCDPRRHGLTKLDELRSVPSSSAPSFFSVSAPSSPSSAVILSVRLPGLPSPSSNPPPLISVVFYFPVWLDSNFLRRCSLRCCVDDASGFHTISAALFFLHTDCVGLSFTKAWSRSHQCGFFAARETLSFSTKIKKKKQLTVSIWQQIYSFDYSLCRHRFATFSLNWFLFGLFQVKFDDSCGFEWLRVPKRC